MLAITSEILFYGVRILSVVDPMGGVPPVHAHPSDYAFLDFVLWFDDLIWFCKNFVSWCLCPWVGTPSRENPGYATDRCDISFTFHCNIQFKFKGNTFQYNIDILSVCNHMRDMKFIRRKLCIRHHPISGLLRYKPIHYWSKVWYRRFNWPVCTVRMHKKSPNVHI